MLFSLGCSWMISDEDAVQLVHDYFLFNHGGEKVKASVAERGEYIESCKCYPMKFKIIFEGRRNNNKTFYFYKNEAGQIDVKRYM
ncbi:MAG: hypothetical protein ACW99E_23350 [Promethearchaeota archaeon]